MSRVRLPVVRSTAVGKVSVGTVWWMLGSQLNLTICAKATFAMVPGGEMELIDPELLRRDERKELPSLAVTAPADLVPRLPRPEVTLTGHAFGNGASRLAVRLAITREGATVLDKRLDVLGDRDKDGNPQPFNRIPLDYERAIGGIGFLDNPLGRGRGAASGPAANVIDPADPEGRVGSFAPIPAAFAARKTRLHKLSPRRLSAAVVDVPDSFDWHYFQAASEDQQLEALSGDEWIWLEGMHPQHKRFRSALPRVRALARVSGSGADQLALRAESLHVDADAARCTLVWRRSVACAADQPSVWVAAAIEMNGEPVTWPAEAEVGGAAVDVVTPLVDAPVPSDGTIVLEDKRAHTASDHMTTIDAHPVESPTTPFGRIERSSAPRVTRDIPGAPWSTEAAATLVKPTGKSTVRLDDTETTRAGSEPAAASTPFPKVEPSADRVRVASEIPGAPWSNEAARPLEKPSGKLSTLRLDDDDDIAIVAAGLFDEMAAARKAEEAARDAKAKAEAEAAAGARAAREAEERRQAQAARFAAEQEAAREAARAREAAKAAEKSKAAAKLVTDIYGRFKR